MPKPPQLVEPRTLKGFLDYLPEDLIHRRGMIRTIEGVFERYGFLPVDTPALEYLDVLLGPAGEELNKEIFRFETPELEPVGLRFDLTVPFARLLAQYPDKLKPPFRRYALGPVWRADKPGPGRYRQFTQFDIDIAGAPDVIADAEIVAVMVDVMTALGAPDFRVLINHRGLIDALLGQAGVRDESEQKHVLRVIDKLQKVGIENVRLELGPGRIDDSGDPIPGVGLAPNVIEDLLAFIAITGATRREVIQNLEQGLGASPAATEALEDMRTLVACLDALLISEEHAVFAPSLARGLDYYTGPVFEMTIPSAPEFGSVMAGGRYNQLVARFLDREIACTGMSVGLDRLTAALTHLGAVQPAESTVQALIVTMGKVPPETALQVAMELRAAGIATDVYVGKKKRLGDQLSHADRYGIPVAVILGEEEVARGEVALKDLAAGKTQREGIAEREEYRKAGKTAQITVPRSELSTHVQTLLRAGNGS